MRKQMPSPNPVTIFHSFCAWDLNFRANAKVGNGSTADVFRYEQTFGVLLSRTGHGQKVQNSIDGLVNVLGKNISPTDRAIAENLLKDLRDAATF